MKESPQKKLIEINIRDGRTTSLRALTSLSKIKERCSFHKIQGHRHPRGIYIRSIERLCRRLQKLSEIVEESSTIEINSISKELMSDYIELCLHSTSAHMDDVKNISKCFFEKKSDYRNNSHHKDFSKKLKRFRSEISAITNYIKHNYGRINISYSIIQYGQKRQNFICFNIDNYEDGDVKFLRLFANKDGEKYSISSFIMNILILIYELSELLFMLIDQLNIEGDDDSYLMDSDSFASANIAASRIPQYSFDDDHPFNRYKYVLCLDHQSFDQTICELDGTLRNRWDPHLEYKFVRGSMVLFADSAPGWSRLALPFPKGLINWIPPSEI